MVEDAMDYAVASNDPYTIQQDLNITCNSMYKSNMFRDKCKEWWRLPAPQKTWPAFKQLFADTHKDLRCTQTISTM